MAHQKRNLFAVLGWIAWKLLALVGVPAAKKKLRERSGSRA